MSDKRKVSTDALETLGTIIDANEKRDAIHLAVEPVMATQKLFPAQDVGLVEGGAGVCDKPLGIVDPFLKEPVYPGQYFWLVVYPRKINSLRHVWEHPDFPDESNNTSNQIVESKKWIGDLAGEYNLSYDQLMYSAEEYLKNGKYLIGGSEMESACIPDEFWEHYEIVTGHKVDEDERGNFFSCSC